MTSEDSRKSIVMMAVVAAALLLPAAMVTVERAADVVMPVPTLSGDVVELDCPPGAFEKELQRVVRLARGVGGTASAWNDGASVRITANVPPPAEKLFRESVSRGVYDIAAAGEAKPGAIVQVVLRPSATDAGRAGPP
jgi:hypothetical protein